MRYVRPYATVSPPRLHCWCFKKHNIGKMDYTQNDSWEPNRPVWSEARGTFSKGLASPSRSPFTGMRWTASQESG